MNRSSTTSKIFASAKDTNLSTLWFFSRTSGYRSKPRRKTLFYILLLVVLIVVVLALVIGLGAGLGTRGSAAFYRSVKAANLLGHLRVLINNLLMYV